MVEYYAFYDNIRGRRIVPVAFASKKQAEDFIEKYEYYGEIKQFTYDHYGKSRKGFIEWLNRNSPIGYGLSMEKQIVRSPQKMKDLTLFKYMLSSFGIKLKESQ